MGLLSRKRWMTWARDVGASATALGRGVSTSSPAALLGAGLECSHVSMDVENAATVVEMVVGIVAPSAAPAFAIAAIEAVDWK